MEGRSYFRWPFACIPMGMRPFPHNRRTSLEAATPGPGRLAALPFVVLLTASACTLGCVGVGAGATPQPPTPPASPITVAVTPASATVILGNTQAFAATVTNTTDAGVSWSVNGVRGGDAAVGTITAAGLYTAPADLPSTAEGSTASVQVTAVSHADATKSASSLVTVTSDLAILIAPSRAAVELGATRGFQATISSNGHPDTSVVWGTSGGACSSGCGAVDASGNFTAPRILPNPAAVTLTARSVADPTKQATAAVTITSNFLLQLSAPASVPVRGSATLAAMFTPVPGSNPSQALTWSLSGGGCNGASCGVLSVVTTQSAGGTPVADSATYTAPEAAPSPNTVTITVTPQADPSKSAQATLTIQPGGGVSVSPATATLAGNHRVTLTAQVNGITNTAVNWSVNGVAGGNGTLGQICVVGTNPCQPVTNGTAAQVDYLAPGAIPSPNPVTVQATSAVVPAKSGSAQITVINHVVVSVLPGNVTLAPLGVQRFTVTVIGTSNQSVVWQVQGAACTGGMECGSVDQNGTYTAPDATPSPDTLQVVAVSSDDPTQSGIADVAISTGANIVALHPASVYAGAADGFILRVDGSGFAAASPGPGSVLLIGGTARATTCDAATECTTTITPADVATVRSLSVQVQNPDGTKSNVVSLVVAAPNASDEVIALTSGAPSATAKDIVVVEPTTAGVSVPSDDVDLNIAALGVFSVASNTCTLGGNPVAVARPASGTGTTDICLFSESALDTSMTLFVSGTGDVMVVSTQALELGILRVTLQISASAIPGARTVFLQNTNLDKTAASGALEVN
jgi:hypothetical protein